MTIAKNLLVEQALMTVLFLSNDEDGTPLDSMTEIRAFVPDAKQKIERLVDAAITTAPPSLPIGGREIHRAVCSVMGHGTGLWDDHKEDWEGKGDKWHKDLLAAVPDLRDFSAVLTDDNKVHIG